MSDGRCLEPLVSGKAELCLANRIRADHPKLGAVLDWEHLKHGATMKKEKWGQLRQRLVKTVGQNNYKNWIEPIEFHSAENGVATFESNLITDVSQIKNSVATRNPNSMINAVSQALSRS